MDRINTKTLKTFFLYQNVNTNRLSGITHNADAKHYTYNNLGAVTSIASMNGNDTTLAEQFGYAGDGRIKRYTKKLFTQSQYNCGVTSAVRNSVNQFDWYYRYSVLGSREQKRLYYSPGGDSICGEFYNHHSWTYYMLGAGGEQLAVYKGVQAAHMDSSGHMGRRVYMYNESYISLGGTLVTLPDNTKQFNAMDNIGSVRLTVSVNGDSLRLQCFDYKPFGDTLNAEDESRIGYASQERDEESRYFAMGARQYDPLAGRFLSVDPLYESFPDKTPYHYCNNNPISFKDPSGLSPEGEKGKEDEVQVVYYQDFSFCYELQSKLQDRMDEARNERKLFNMKFDAVFNFLTHNKSNWLEDFWGDSGGGAGSGGSMANYWGIITARNREGISNPVITNNVNGTTKIVKGSFHGIPVTFEYSVDYLEGKGLKDSKDEKMHDYIRKEIKEIGEWFEDIYSTDLGNKFFEKARAFGGLYFDFTWSTSELTNEYIRLTNDNSVECAPAFCTYFTEYIPNWNKYYLKQDRIYIGSDWLSAKRFESKCNFDPIEVFAHEMGHFYIKQTQEYLINLSMYYPGLVSIWEQCKVTDWGRQINKSVKR